MKQNLITNSNLSKFLIKMFIKIFQQIMYVPTRLIIKLFFDHKIKGSENIKGLEKKTLIFAANHLKFFDPIIIGYSLPINFAPLRYIAAKEYFNFIKSPVPFPLSVFVALYLRINGSLPVDREKNKGNLDDKLKKAVEVLKKGGKIFIFPEGKISKNGELQKFKRGVAYLYKETNAPVIPVAIIYRKNGKKLFGLIKRKKAIIKFGEPIYNLEGSLEEIADYIREKVALLIEEEKEHAVSIETKNDF